MICPKCTNEKPLTMFYENSVFKSGYHPWCRPCFGKVVRNTYLKRTYGITTEQYEDLLKAQEGRCAICPRTEDTLLRSGKSKSFAVDHDHVTGEVRGLLCENCNRGIGLFNDDPELLKRAIEYLY